MLISAPCINVCVIDRLSALCIGCGRTTAEIAAWPTMSEAERASVMDGLGRRLVEARSRGARGGRVRAREEKSGRRFFAIRQRGARETSELPGGAPESPRSLGRAAGGNGALHPSRRGSGGCGGRAVHDPVGIDPARARPSPLRDRRDRRLASALADPRPLAFGAAERHRAHRDRGLDLVGAHGRARRRLRLSLRGVRGRSAHRGRILSLRAAGGAGRRSHRQPAPERRIRDYRAGQRRPRDLPVRHGRLSGGADGRRRQARRSRVREIFPSTFPSRPPTARRWRRRRGSTGSRSGRLSCAMWPRWSRAPTRWTRVCLA